MSRSGSDGVDVGKQEAARTGSDSPVESAHSESESAGSDLYDVFDE